jgi:hypothetical protein
MNLGDGQPVLGPLEPFLEMGRDNGIGQEPKPFCIAALSQVPDLLTEGGKGN